MVRNRSRSRSRSTSRDREKERERIKKERDREREREKERDRNRDRHHRKRSSKERERSRSRSRSPRHKKFKKDKSRSKSPIGSLTLGNVKPKTSMGASFIVDPNQLEGKTDEEIEMLKIMGFAGFDTTKGKHVEGTNHSAINIQQKRKYRQYMNRKGGFNRPLDPVA